MIAEHILNSCHRAVREGEGEGGRLSVREGEGTLRPHSVREGEGAKGG